MGTTRQCVRRYPFHHNTSQHGILQNRTLQNNINAVQPMRTFFRRRGRRTQASKNEYEILTCPKQDYKAFLRDAAPLPEIEEQTKAMRERFEKHRLQAQRNEGLHYARMYLALT